MAKGEAGAWREIAGALRVGEEAIKRNATETDYNAEILEQAQLLIEPGCAVTLLLGGGFVGGGSASYDGADPKASEAHAIVARAPHWL
jgi:hypothetical protein